MPLQPLAQLISKQCRCHSQLVNMDETAAVPCRIPSAAAAYLLCVGACSCCTVASRGLRTTPTSSLALLLRTYHLVGGARNQLVNPHSRQWLVAVPRPLHSAHHTACKRMCWLLAWCHSQILYFVTETCRGVLLTCVGQDAGPRLLLLLLVGAGHAADAAAAET